MDIKVEFNSCGINADTLDDWLESDLRQSGILPSDNKKEENIKCEPYDFSMINNMKWERQSSVDGSDDNTTVVNDSDGTTTTTTKGGGDITKDKSINNNNNLLASPDITPFLKALAILTTLHQQGQPSFNNSNNHHHNTTTMTNTTISPLSTILPNVINPLEMTKKNPTSITPRTIIPNLTTKGSNNNSNNNNNNIKKRLREEEDEEEELTKTTIPTTTQNNESNIDPIILKRQKNTDAARRSRLRKVLKMEAMEKRVSELEKNNEQLRLQVILSETERDNAKLKEAQQRERVAKLEEQLAEAHRSLLMKDQQQQQHSEGDADHDNNHDDNHDDDMKQIIKGEIIKEETGEN
ncbi:unnamed protein product [Cunninghamella echinulata]